MHRLRRLRRYLPRRSSPAGIIRHRNKRGFCFSRRNRVFLSGSAGLSGARHGRAVRLAQPNARAARLRRAAAFRLRRKARARAPAQIGGRRRNSVKRPYRGEAAPKKESFLPLNMPRHLNNGVYFVRAVSGKLFRTLRVNDFSGHDKRNTRRAWRKNFTAYPPDRISKPDLFVP